MSQQSVDILGTAVSYEDCVPLMWKPGSDSAGSGYVLNMANERILRTLLLLNDGNSIESDDEDARLPELQRLDLKINIALDLLAELVIRDAPLPMSRSVRIAATGLEWRQPEPLVDGAQGVIEVYLDKKYPRSLCLPARLVAVEKLAQEFKIVAIYEDVSEVVNILLEKLVFKRHRRHIAHVRRSIPR